MKRVVQFPWGKRLNKSTSDYVLVNMRSEIIIIEKLIGILINAFWTETLEGTMLIGQKKYWIIHLWKTHHTPMQTNAQIGEKTTRLLDETKGICAHRSNNKKKNHTYWVVINQNFHFHFQLLVNGTFRLWFFSFQQLKLLSALLTESHDLYQCYLLKILSEH